MINLALIDSVLVSLAFIQTQLERDLIELTAHLLL